MLLYVIPNYQCVITHHFCFNPNCVDFSHLMRRSSQYCYKLLQIIFYFSFSISSYSYHVISNNNNESKPNNIGRHQRGGIATIIREQLAAFIIGSGVDHIELGRWSWYQVEGEPGHRTYFITSYTPCGNTRVGEAMV